MFEYFVRPHVCLSVSPSTHRKHVTCVDGAFYFKFGFGWEGRGFETGSLFWGGGSVSLKFSFVRGWGWFYFEFLEDYFLSRGFFSLSVLWWKFINICLTFTNSFTQFFCVLLESVSVNCFGKISVALKGPGWCDLCRLIR